MFKPTTKRAANPQSPRKAGPTILDGRACREALMPRLSERVKALPTVPTLAIIQVGDRPDSTSFINAKKAFARKLGVNEKHIKASEDVSQSELIDIIGECNRDAAIKGIIVQLPLPVGLDKDAVIEAIDPRKDVDALTAVSVKGWLEGREDAILPATARGIRTLLGHYKIDLFGKRIAVIGRSMLVGKPIAAMCLNENATVSVCHSKTPDLAAELKAADIIIVAAGRPGLVGGKHVRKGQVVIDVGINRPTGEKLDEEIEESGGQKEAPALVGDVDFISAAKKASAITPVPGGVGPMTVFSLLENLIDLCQK
ncbi:MAG: bifunctional 5,10-methylenetetrahydrofolate dehydrogenase/5,10-methenyltetrahydrofolate cyclohydrolase [Patescibacteria group bacterium]|nr:bifunctional 5,10-methylenetetrahydrofolate dehydrogenase/5,10-methenyltetrahydrofolate cyclohydrolase [Patescibacteria group bacterium]